MFVQKDSKSLTINWSVLYLSRNSESVVNKLACINTSLTESKTLFGKFENYITNFYASE